MTKILGLDLGTNSIGWAVVENNKILGMGSRIFPEGVIAKTIGTGEREESKNASRRNSRQQRRQFYRKRLRKAKLLRTLIDLKMCPLTHQELDKWIKWNTVLKKAGRRAPNSDAYIKWHRMNPYMLREKGLKKDLTLFEMGRVLYHLIQRRGFLSNRKGKDEGKIYKGKKGMVGITETQKYLSKKTLGSFLYSISPKEGEAFKLITDENGNELRVRARYTLRNMYIEEFEQIWNRQAKQLNLENKTAIKTKILFLKGSLNENIRNKSKIEKLQGKYGVDNVKIEKLEGSSKKGLLHKITVSTKVPLKMFLGGKIEKDERGNLKFKSNESVLFWQRPLRSQKGLLAKCRFEPDVKDKNGNYLQRGKTPCHLSHPLYEEFRAWQVINNIKYGKNQKLENSQSLQILELINSKDSNFNFSEIPKRLKMIYEKWNYGNDQKIAGNYTIKHLKPLFSNEVWNKKYEIETKNQGTLFEYGYEKIWHCFHFFEDNDILLKKLKNDFGLKDKYFEKIPKINIKEGYSNVSLKAIKNILPYLRQGYQMSDATILAGVQNSFGNRWEYFINEHKQIEKDILKIIHKRDNKESESIANIKSYLINNKFGFEKNDINFIKLYHHSQEIKEKVLQDKLDPVENLRNPIVQQGVNETTRLVNKLIDKFGKFDKIQIELGRNIKNSKKGRQKQSSKISENTTKNDSARKLLTEYGLKHSRDNIQKVLLYKEMQDRGVTTICPYTNKSLNINDVLGRENKIQIEHIFPKSISLNDSFANKTLCESKFNSLKGNLTPYQFYLKNGDSKLWGGATSWQEIEQRVYRVLPYYKAKRFTSKIKINNTDVKNNFIERQLNDTRYISKKVKEIMSQVCKDVRVLPGKLTSELRHLWGLNNILQPVMLVDLPRYKFEKGKSIPHYVVLNKKNKPISVIPVYKEKPLLKKNETTIAGKVDKGVFKTTNNFIKLNIDAPQLVDGSYWLKLKLSEPKDIIRIFKERPTPTENEIVLRGKIEKGKFSNQSISRIAANNLDNGSYWAKLPVTNIKFETPEKGKQPKKTGRQIVLFGEVKENVFKSYIFKCSTNKQDGKYWVIIDVETENVSFDKAINEKPIVTNKSVIIEGSVNDVGVFVSEMDTNHQFKTSQKQGKYWFVFNVIDDFKEFNAIENVKPVLEKEQTLVEGTIWVDKYTGEIKFDPKKNRDDHRHHAIDALVIALSKQRYFQELSRYNALREAKKKGLIFDKEQLDFPDPWENFHRDAKNEVEKILISHKQNKNVLTKVTKKITKNGKTYISVGDAVRGQLHKEYFYGERQAPMKISKGYHIRKKVSDLKNNQLNKIVDDKIKNIITKARIEEVVLKKEIVLLEKIKKKAKTDQEENNINNQINILKNKIQSLYTLKNKNGEPIPIKKVRIREEMSNAQQLKEINQFVNPRNNHHILIYKDEQDKLKENIVSFWDVVARQKDNQRIYQLPSEDKKGTIIVTLQENDMFIMGLTNEEFRDNKMNSSFLTKHLYRVQKISKMDILFRHHLASTINKKEQEVRVASLKKYKRLMPKKVEINELGEIKEVN